MNADQYTTERRARLAKQQRPRRRMLTRYVRKQWGWGRTCGGCGKAVWRGLFYCPAPRHMSVVPRIWKCWGCYLHDGHGLPDR